MQFKTINWAKYGPLTLGAVLVSACSNSATSEPPPPPANVAPTVQAGDDISSDEKSEIMLGASASDSDGSIASYSWAQTSGTGVTLTGADSANIEFTAPIAKTEETLTFEVTVTDNEGATASDSVSVRISPVNEISFQIQGLVWNGAAVPSDVTVTFAEAAATDSGNFDKFLQDVLTVSTDSDGNYVVDIAADEDLATELLFLQSVSSSDPEIVFANIPVTLQSLMDKVGSDNILDANENLGVNLTPLSTAYYSLILQQVGSVSSEDQIANAVGQISATEAITLATDIKLISENNVSGNSALALPGGYANTLEFASDRNGVVAYNNGLGAGNGTADFNDAKLSLLADDNMVLAVGDQLAGFPITMTMNTPGGFVVSRITFNADNTALYSGGGASTDAEWSQDANGIITLTGANGNPLIEIESFPFKEVNGNFEQVRALTTTSQVVLTPILDLPVGTLYDVARTVTQSFPDNPGIPDEDFSQSFEVSFIAADEYLDIDIESLFNAGTETTLLTSFFKDSFNPISDPSRPTAYGDHQTHYNADLISLSRTGTDTNGTAATTFNGTFFSNGVWELVDPKVLKVTFDSTRDGPAVAQEITYEMISKNLVSVIAYEAGEIDGLSNGVFAVKGTGQGPASEVDAEGFYNFPLGISTNAQNMFWTELKANNEAELVTLFDNDGDGIQENDEVNIRQARWQLTVDGKIEVSEYRFPITRAPNCNPDVDIDCVLNRRSTIDVAERDGANLYLLNELSIYAPDNLNVPLSDEFWYQTTARFQEYSTIAPVDISALPPQ